MSDGFWSLLLIVSSLIFLILFTTQGLVTDCFLSSQGIKKKIEKKHLKLEYKLLRERYKRLNRIEEDINECIIHGWFNIIPEREKMKVKIENEINEQRENIVFKDLK